MTPEDRRDIGLALFAVAELLKQLVHGVEKLASTIQGQGSRELMAYQTTMHPPTPPGIHPALTHTPKTRSKKPSPSYGPTTLRIRCLELVTANPKGMTGPEICSHFPNATGSVTGTLARLFKEGMIVRKNGRYTKPA